MFCQIHLLRMICLNDYKLAKELIQPKRDVTAQELTLGVLAGSTPYTVYAYREGVDKVKKMDVTTDGSGNLTVDLSQFPAGYFRAFDVFYFWATLPNANMGDNETITIGAETATSIKVEFVRVQDYDNVNNQDLDILVTSQTIKLV